MSLFDLIKKNLKLLIRSRSSAVIIIIAPLLILFLVGVAFDNANKYGLNIGVFYNETSQMIDSFINILQESNFKIIKYESEEKCIKDIKDGSIHTCIIFPEGLGIPESDKVQEIKYYVDYSRINLVWMITNTISQKISEKSNEISKMLVNSILEKLKKIKEEAVNKESIAIETSSKIEDVLTKANNAKTKIAAINLSFDINKFNISEINNKIDNLKSSLNSLLNSIESSINDVKSDPGISNNSIDLLNSALDDVDNAKQLLNGNTTNDSLVKISELLDSVQLKLIETKNKLDIALNNKNLALQELDGLITLISESKNKINELKNSIENIKTISSSMKIQNATTIVKPIVTVIKPVTSKRTYLNYLFPALIVVVIMFISILLASTIVMMEKHSAAYFRNFITPTKDFMFVFSTFLTNIIIVFIQILIILLMSAFFFKAAIFASFLKLLPVLILISAMFTVFGMFIGYLFNSEETAILAGIALGIILLFLSGIILPLEVIPSTLRTLINYNPFVLSEFVTRKIILFNPSLSSFTKELLIISGYLIFGFIVVWLLQKAITRHYLARLASVLKKKK